MAASAKQDYNRSHFSRMDVKDLKQEYEDFFAVEEKPPEQLAPATGQGTSNTTNEEVK